ncbi:MAG: DNA repair protein RecO [Phycisphaerae bacterium]|nr:DNA repair protein RecO [Phycisphaerae bacterium]
MPVVSDMAVVLRRIEYSETSQVLGIFTRGHGQVRVIAKGAKRSTKSRFSPGIDLLEEGHVSFSARADRGEGLSTLTEWKQARSFCGLREKLERLAAGQYVAETTLMMTVEGDAHAVLYDSLTSALQSLCDGAAELEAALRYQRALLESAGAWPRLEGCVVCGRGSALTYFSSLEGGMVCRDCEGVRVEKRAVAGPTLEMLRGLEGAGDAGGSPVEEVVVRAFDVLDYHIAHLAGREAVTASMLVPRSRRKVT